MSHFFWYGLLAFISSCLFIFTLIKTRDKKVIVLYTFLSGLTYLFEYIIFVLLKSYVYYPEVMKNPYFDNILGSVVSNAFVIPMLGTFIGSFHLRWKWRLILVGVLFFIEEGFLYLDIYSHYWWKTIYSSINVIICFMIAERLFWILQSSITSTVRFVTLFFAGLMIQASAVYFLVALFGVYHYHIGWFDNPTRDHVAFATAYIIIYAIIFSILVTFRSKWWLEGLTIILSLLMDWVLMKINILQLSPHWSIISFLFLRLELLFLLILYSHYLLDPIHDERAGNL